MIAILEGILPGLRTTRVTLVSGSLWLTVCFVAIVGSGIADLDNSRCDENLTCKLLQTTPTTINFLPSLTVGLVFGLLIWSLGILGGAVSDLLYSSFYKSQPLDKLRTIRKNYQDTQDQRNKLVEKSEADPAELKYWRMTLVPLLNRIPAINLVSKKFNSRATKNRKLTIGSGEKAFVGKGLVSAFDQQLVGIISDVYRTAAGQSIRTTEEALFDESEIEAAARPELSDELAYVTNSSPSELEEETKSLEILKFTAQGEKTYEKLTHDLSEINLKLAASVPFAAIAIEFAAFHRWSLGTTIFCSFIILLAARIWHLSAKDKFGMKSRVCRAISQADLDTSSLRRVRQIGASHAEIFGNNVSKPNENDNKTVINIKNDGAAISTNHEADQAF